MKKTLLKLVMSVFIFSIGGFIVFPIVDFIAGKSVSWGTAVEGLIFGVFIGFLFGGLEFIMSLSKRNANKK